MNINPRTWKKESNKKMGWGKGGGEKKENPLKGLTVSERKRGKANTQEHIKSARLADFN